MRRTANRADLGARERSAAGSVTVLLRSDGQQRVEHIAHLLERIDAGADMGIVTRVAPFRVSVLRYASNWFYNWLAAWITGCNVLDLTSRCRAVDVRGFWELLCMLQNDESNSTISNMYFARVYGRVRRDSSGVASWELPCEHGAMVPSPRKAPLRRLSGAA